MTGRGGATGDGAGHGRLFGALTILVVTALAVALVQGWGRGTSRAKADHSASPAAAVPVVLSGTDLAFIQLMIPMNDQALAFFSYLDSSAATTPALRELAGRLTSTHRAELAELRSLLAAGDVTEENIHEGHQMPGMITELRVADVRAAPAAEFGPRVVTLIREHLAQSAVVARSEQESGGSDRTKALAAGLERSRNEELVLLDAVPGADSVQE
ncbi:DUF305 domain-containing protein [Micromonospora sp. NPDC050417]|uniref:DUF305 domain-containing protein n=1 Tax=Micromonospora sp. NPDC050417 TaxID=3364280 RepID=UPI003790D6BF